MQVSQPETVSRQIPDPKARPNCSRRVQTFLIYSLLWLLFGCLLGYLLNVFR
jgi:hypothetical protein